MKSKQRFQLAQIAIIMTSISITAIVIVWLIVANNPSSLKATINLSEQTVEVDCDF